MALPEFTTLQITTILKQLSARMQRLEKMVRSMIVDDDSGSFLSKVTSQSSGIGSVSGSWSAEHARSDIGSVVTSGTGSDSISMPELENLPGTA